MISVEALANLLGITVNYLVLDHLGIRNNQFVRILSKGYVTFPKAVDIILAEANKPFSTALARQAQRKLADGSIRCGADGFLKVS